MAYPNEERDPKNGYSPNIQPIQATPAATGVIRYAPGDGAKPAATAPAQPEPVAAAQPAAADMSYGEQMRNVGGAIADAAGALVKTAVGYPGYGLGALGGAPTAPVATPAAAARVPAAGAPSAAALPAAAAAPAAASPAAVNPSAITKTVGPGGAVTYSNVDSDPAFAARGAVSPQNDAAAAALASRYTGGAGAAAPPAEGTQPAGAGMTVVGGTGGFGLLDNSYRAARAARMDQESAADALPPGLSAGRRAAALTQLATNAANNTTARDNAALSSATQLTTNANSNDTQRRGQDLTAQDAAARRGLDVQRVGADVAREGAQTEQMKLTTKQAQEIAGAQSAYAEALQGGGKKTIDAAEKRLRGLQGKWEQPNRFSVVPGGTVLGPNGETIHQPAQVFNQETGQFMQAPPQQGNQPPAQAKKTPEGSISEVGGKKAVMRNGQWVPL